MNIAFGNARTIPISEKAKNITRELGGTYLFNEQGDVWRLGAALGIAFNKVYTKEKRGTFQTVLSLDPDQILSAVMLGLYPDMSPDERLKKLVDHAEWGMREIYRKSKNGTLDFTTLGLNTIDETPKEDEFDKIVEEPLKATIRHKTN